VGAPLSQLYTRFMGGHMQWALVQGDGREVPLLDQVGANYLKCVLALDDRGVQLW